MTRRNSQRQDSLVTPGKRFYKTKTKEARRARNRREAQTIRGRIQ